MAPLLVVGMVARVVPAFASLGQVVGGAVMLLVTTPVTVHTLRLRRANQAAYRAAAASARAEGKVVRVVETDAGDYDYLLFEPPHVEPLRPEEWGRPEE
jgi:hypothetical protein